MGFYGNQVLPRVINRIMDVGEMHKVRARTCAGLTGDVVEIGFGSGLNVQHYPSEVTGVWAVEPSDVAWRLAAERVTASPVPVVRAGLDGERLDLPDDRFDSALSTWTLCTIPRAEVALAELRRVLKPGGCFHFAEHGLSPDPGIARRQHRFEPVQIRFGGGCHLTRDMRDLIAGAGFEIEDLENFTIRGPKIATYLYVGRARNP